MANVATFISARALVNESRLAGSNVVKEMVDLKVNQLLAIVLLMLMAPMLLIVMVLIWHVDGAPILFGHYRVGKNGRLFRCLKFRSMRRDADQVLAELLENDPEAAREWKSDRKLTHDPRITAVGNFLRRTSLDELPQLLNVIRGDMHLVGPRPVTVAELEKYGSSRWHYVSVKPGMTGLWQVSGRNNTSYEERVALDRRYVESQSMAFDAAILLKTVKVVLFREGAVTVALACGVVLLVARADQDQLAELNEGVRRLNQAGVPIDGLLFNGMKLDKRYNSRYYYRHRSYRSAEQQYALPIGANALSR